MSATIRRMREEDIDAILELEQICFKTPWTRADFESELDNDIALYLVFETEGEVAGYIGSWLVLDEAHITNIAVSPDHRRMHIASALMRTLVDVAERAGVIAITLEVRPSNTAALALYEGFGFKEEGRRKGYYFDTGEDAIIMWRRSDKKSQYEDI